MGTLLRTRNGRRKDREAIRRRFVRPLLEMGMLEKVTRLKCGAVVPGHPVPRSPRCCYRLTSTSSTIPRPAAGILPSRPVSTHEGLMDACCHYWEARGYVRVYRDPCEGRKITLQDAGRLAEAGLGLDLRWDPCPDLVFWHPATLAVCVVEAVISVGPIDDRRRRELGAWLGKYRTGDVDYVTAFASWRNAVRFLPTLSPQSAVWVLGQLWRRGTDAVGGGGGR